MSITLKTYLPDAKYIRPEIMTTDNSERCLTDIEEGGIAISQGSAQRSSKKSL